MGRPSTRGARPPDWDALTETAQVQAGLFSASQARAAGFGDALLSYHVKAGTLARVGRGLFRLAVLPPDPLEEYVAVWLWSGQEGVFSHETALQLHQLSDALPARHHLSVPISWARRRVRPPPLVLLHVADVPEDARDWHGPVPVTGVLRTLLDCHAAGALDFVRQAERQAVARGLLAKGVFTRALAEQGRGASATRSHRRAGSKEAPR